MKKLTVILFTLIISIGLLFFASCRSAPPPTPDVQVKTVEKITLDPSDAVWDDAPMHLSKLILQDLVEPRLMEASTPEVRVKAISAGGEMAFRLEWPDDSQNDLPGPKRFMDACAVQLPLVNETNVPAPQMGEAGKTVEISYWRADWQAVMDGRADDINAIYPNASVDHYPFEAKSLEADPNAQRDAALRYAPARTLGNRRAGPRESPVEDLIAEGPGTLTPNTRSISNGKGMRGGKGWAVVISRALPEGFSAERPSQVAFAVWEGNHGETGARKMRTGWVQLTMK